MSKFPLFTLETAPDPSRLLLEKAQSSFGFVPNLLGKLATSPVALEGYITLMQIFSKSSLSSGERQVVMMTFNRLNGCTYCMAAHSMISQSTELTATEIEALRSGDALPEERLEALRIFAQIIFETRGNPEESDLKTFYEAGFTPAQVLDVILGASAKTLSNYANHIVKTPLDDAFKAHVWTP